jgi:hypothetical protein
MDKGKYGRKEGQKKEKKKKENDVVFIGSEWIKRNMEGIKDNKKKKIILFSFDVN